MKYLTIIVVAIMVCIPLVACTNSPDVPMVAFATVTQIEKLQTYIDTGLASKGNKADVDAIIARINAVEQKVNQSAAPNLTNYYTKAEVDAAVAKAITDYKATIVGGTGTQTPSNPTGVTGNIITILDPSAPQIIGSTLGFSFIARFKNTGTATLYVSPSIKATQTTGSAATQVTAFTVTTSASSYAPVTFTYAPNVFPTTLGTTQVRAIATGGGYNSNGQLPIFGNTELIVTFTVALSSTVATQWYFTVEQ